jgi:hypothetical protein
MKKLMYTLIILWASLTGMAHAQQVTQPAAAVEKMLCKKWEVSYVTMQGMRIGQMPDNQRMAFEFFKDKTVLFSGNKTAKSAKGSWVYDQKQKLISVTVKNGAKMKISSLKPTELMMAVDMPAQGSPMPANGAMTQIQLVLKPR